MVILVDSAPQESGLITVPSLVTTFLGRPVEAIPTAPFARHSLDAHPRLQNRALSDPAAILGAFEAITRRQPVPLAAQSMLDQALRTAREPSGTALMETALVELIHSLQRSVPANDAFPIWARVLLGDTIVPGDLSSPDPDPDAREFGPLTDDTMTACFTTYLNAWLVGAYAERDAVQPAVVKEE